MGMLSLIEKMKQRVPAPGSRAQVRDDDDCPGMICPGDWCCTDADLTCCEEDSPYVCADDPDVCDTCPGQMCDGDWCCPFDDWTCCDEDSDYICAVDADSCDDDDCDGQICPGGWCCPTDWTCCDEYDVCALGPSYC